jgi:hypothetical protein
MHVVIARCLQNKSREHFYVRLSLGAHGMYWHKVLHIVLGLAHHLLVGNYLAASY